jgi:segregation and condensation protein B
MSMKTDANKEELRRAIETLLFITDQPINLNKLTQSVGAKDKDKERVAELVAEIQKDYEEGDRAMQVLEIADGFQMATRPAFADFVRKLYQEKMTMRLSTAALETVSIISYKQPITRAEIEEIRGVEVIAAIETLLEKNLIRVVGRKESVGRPLLYGTTQDFLRQFGLRSVDDLPSLDGFDVAPPADAKAQDGQHGPFAPRPETEDSEGTVEAVAAENSEVVVEDGVAKESSVPEAVVEDAVSEEAASTEAVLEEVVSDEPTSAEAVLEEVVSDEPPSTEAVLEEVASDEPAPTEAVLEEVASDEPAPTEAVLEEVVSDEPASIDAVSEEVVSDDPTPNESVDEVATAVDVEAALEAAEALTEKVDSTVEAPEPEEGASATIADFQPEGSAEPAADEATEEADAPSPTDVLDQTKGLWTVDEEDSAS